MEKKYFIYIVILFIIAFLIPSIFAVTTKIKVKTLQQSKLYLAILETGEIYSVIESFPYKKTGIGELDYNIETTAGFFDVKLTLKSDEFVVLDQRLEQVYGGGDVTINFIPGKVNVSYNNETAAEVLNTTANETNTTDTNVSGNSATASVTNNTSETSDNTTKTTNTSDIDPATSDPVTGSASDSTKTNYSLSINQLIIIGIVILVVLVIIIFLIIFLVLRKKNKFNDPHPPSSIKFRHKTDKNYDETERELEKAEKKLKEAREEIDKIKKRNELISEAERKLREDKERLEKLKRGGL